MKIRTLQILAVTGDPLVAITIYKARGALLVRQGDTIQSYKWYRGTPATKKCGSWSALPVAGHGNEHWRGAERQSPKVFLRQRSWQVVAIGAPKTEEVKNPQTDDLVAQAAEHQILRCLKLFF